VLEQGLAYALHDAAMRLAIKEEGVDDHPKIVDECVLHDLDHAGVRIEFNLGDMAAIREGRGWAIVDIGDVEALRQIGEGTASILSRKSSVIGIEAAGTMLMRRSSARSKPHCRAAASIGRSMMLTPRHIAGAESVEIEKATAPPSAALAGRRAFRHDCEVTGQIGAESPNPSRLAEGPGARLTSA
jgi:hypothetical protein